MGAIPFVVKHRKLAISLAIILVLWGVQTAQNIMSVCGSPGPTTVALVQAPSYPISDANLDALVRDAVAKAGGLEGVISPGDFVVIKPNLVETMWTSGSGVVTDKRVVRTVVRMAQEAGAGRVVIAEGTAAYRSNDGNDRHCTKKAFKDSGLDPNGDMKDDETGVELYDLNIAGAVMDYPDPDYVTLVDLGDGLLNKAFYVPNILLECDVLISVPCMKNHHTGTMTGSLKNRVGCAPNDLYHYPGMMFYKHGLVHNHTSYDEKETVNRAIVDLNRVRPADFTVIDGLIGIIDGPCGAGGVATKPNVYGKCIIAGHDATAVDTIETLLVGIQPTSVQHLVNCADIGFGQTNPALITVVGKSVAEARNALSLYPTGYGGAVRIDQTNPSIGGMTPASGSSVRGNVNVALSNVWDNAGVIKAELYVDDELYAVDLGSPWEFVWDSSQYSNGSHTLKAKVYDAALNEGSFTTTVIVEDGWSVSMDATGGNMSGQFTFGTKSGASIGVDAMDIQENVSSPFLSLATLMGSSYYSTDYKPVITGAGDVREWAVYLRTDSANLSSPVTVSWASLNWTQMSQGLELQLLDYGTSWSQINQVYNMRSQNSISLPATGPGVIRHLKVRAMQSTLSAVANCKYLANGQAVLLADVIVTAGNNQFVNMFYVSDPDGNSGIRVAHAAGAVPTVSVGDKVQVQGTLSTTNGERVIVSPIVTLISSGNPAPRIRGMANKSVGGEGFGAYASGTYGAAGPNNVGLPVRTWGKVTHVDTVGRVFYIDDGSNRQDGTGVMGIKIHCGGRAGGSVLDLPAVDSRVVVTGICTTANSSNGIVAMIRPRTQSDIVVP